MMLVTSGWILLAIPKSINLSEAFTMTKFAGFKSLWTIPARPSTVSVKNRDSYCNILKHIKKKKKSWQNLRQKNNHVCEWYGQPPACSSSRTFSPVD